MSRKAPSTATLRHLARLCMTDSVGVSRYSTRPWSCPQSNTPTPQTTSRRALSTSRHLGQTTTSTASPNSTSQPNDPSPATGSLPDITTHYTLFPNTLPTGPPPSCPFMISLPPPTSRIPFSAKPASSRQIHFVPYHPHQGRRPVFAHQQRLPYTLRPTFTRSIPAVAKLRR